MAWCAFEAARWNDEQGAETRAATAARFEAGRRFDLAAQGVAFDASIAADFARGVAEGQEQLQAFNRETFIRPEFPPVIDAWMAQVQSGKAGAANLFENTDHLDQQLADARSYDEIAEAVTDQISALIVETHRRYTSNDEGTNASVYPALAAVPRDCFGLCVIAAASAVYMCGDAECEHSFMSVSKPFVFALICQAKGVEEVRGKIGVESTGLPGKSGVGGIVTVAPPLDAARHSIKGPLATRYLVEQLGLNLFASNPVT